MMRKIILWGITVMTKVLTGGICQGVPGDLEIRLDITTKRFMLPALRAFKIMTVSMHHPVENELCGRATVCDFSFRLVLVVGRRFYTCLAYCFPFSILVVGKYFSISGAARVLVLAMLVAII